ncbi:MAG: transporter [Bacteroidales bacterium]|nr:transporter [Bacteroidales bacterium]
MKNLHFLLFISFIIGLTLPANAQLSEREDNPSVIKTGTRPVEGNFGLFVGPRFSEIREMTDNNIDVRGLPLVNVKYYLSNNVEGRVGIQYYKTKQILEGTLAEDEVGNSVDNQIESFFRLSPGIAYHFSPRNILDAYVGVSIPFGTENNKVETNWENESTGDYVEEAVKKSTFVYGYNFFIGLQAFVADLPFAIGLEYGISGLIHSGLQYEHEYSESIEGNNENQTFYTTDGNNFSVKYDDLKFKKFEGGSDLRITLSYFFGK